MTEILLKFELYFNRNSDTVQTYLLLCFGSIDNVDVCGCEFLIRWCYTNREACRLLLWLWKEVYHTCWTIWNSTEDPRRLPEELYETLNRRFTETWDCSFKSNVSLLYRETFFCYRGLNTFNVLVVVSSRVSAEDLGPSLPLILVPVLLCTGTTSIVSIHSQGVLIQVQESIIWTAVQKSLTIIFWLIEHKTSENRDRNFSGIRFSGCFWFWYWSFQIDLGSGDIVWGTHTPFKRLISQSFVGTFSGIQRTFW